MSKKILMALCVFIFSFMRTSFAGDSVPKIDATTFKFIHGPDWKAFYVYEKSDNFEGVQRTCRDWSGTNQIFYGCSRISFAIKSCYYIYVNGSNEAKKHEKLHCAGYDHTDEKQGEIPLIQEYKKFNDFISENSLKRSRIKGLSLDAAKLETEKKLKDFVADQFRNIDLPVLGEIKNGWALVSIEK